MKVFDLTHTVKEDMTVYPGTDAPRLTAVSTHERDGFRETALSVFSHVGTHIDAPAHIVEGGATLDSLPAEQFIGRALVIDCRDLKEDDIITRERLLSYGSRLDGVDFLLFNLGWDKKWGSEDYLRGYPTLDLQAIDLILEKGYKGIGIDAISLDPISGGLARHKRLFSGRTIINIENLKGLEGLPKQPFSFACLPLKFENSDGAPARAIAWID